MVLRDDVVPLLEEYCYEDFEVLENILGVAFVDVKLKTVRQGLFDEGREQELAAALMEPLAETDAALPQADAEAIDEEESGDES